MDLVIHKVPLNPYLFIILWSIIHMVETVFHPLPPWIKTSFADLNISSIKEIDHIHELNYLWVSDLLKLTKSWVLSWNLNKYEHVKMLTFLSCAFTQILLYQNILHYLIMESLFPFILPMKPASVIQTIQFR